VVLNNQTLTIFETNNPKDSLISIKLPNIQVEFNLKTYWKVVNAKEPNCIDVIDKQNGLKKTLCAMAMLSTDHSENI
jgi:hypothetical protein